MLNKPLFDVLQKHFGEVRVSYENERRVENAQGAVISGETYSVCCPLCNDTKFRLSVSYLWLSRKPLSRERFTRLANCYNENCPVRDELFYGKLLDDLEMAQLGSLALPEPTAAVVEIEPRRVIRLPGECTSLAALPGNHYAIDFVKRKYPFFSIDYLASYYNVMFCAKPDPIYPLAADRIIFPIHEAGELIAWQGRTVHDKVEPRWYLPPGMKKSVYNLDRVPPTSTLVICEGIPAAIACGPEAVAIFGKSMTDVQCAMVAQSHRSVLIATDPDTFVVDPRGGKKTIHSQVLKKKLAKFLPVEPKMIRWPKEILQQATDYVEGRAKSCPDAADLGYLTMKDIIHDSLAFG